MRGGNLLRGKTTNKELDFLYQMYLPSGTCEPCTRLCDVTEGLIHRIANKVKASGRVHYLPVFLRQHWVAGIFRHDGKKKATALSIYDSAPSKAVKDDIIKRLRKVAPGLIITFVEGVRQKRDSEDCGIFMSARFFARALGIKIEDPESLPTRLRAFLHEAHDARMNKEDFLREIRARLMKSKPKKKNNISLEGGASNARTNENEVNEENEENEGARPVPQQVDPEVAALVQKVEPRMATFKRSGKTGGLVAVALQAFAKGENWGFSADAVRNRCTRSGAGQIDPLDFLRKANTEVCEYSPESATPARTRANPQSPFFVLHTLLPGMLPAEHEGGQFKVGAAKEVAGEVSHYSLCTELERATIGLYVRGEAQQAPRDEAATGAQRSVQEEMNAILSEDGEYLKEPGRRIGRTACPTHWRIYRAKPSHVSAAAWNKTSSGTRNQQRRAIMDLHGMGCDLMGCPLPKAAILLIHRLAKARKWRASTVYSKFATMHGALLNLPLYTNATEGIDLKESPEWRAAYGKWHELATKEVPEPVPHVTQEQISEALQKLNDAPMAKLYLGMMWAFAARPGDIGGLRVQDVTVQGSDENLRTFQVGVTYRSGKATHFRGPYPVNSNLDHTLGSALARAMARDATSVLFPNLAEIKNRVTAALKAVNPRLALSSVRKGAVRHMAQHGVPEADIMRMTGHTNSDTLRRYLGYSLQPTREAVAAQANALVLLRGLRT